MNGPDHDADLVNWDRNPDKPHHQNLRRVAEDEFKCRLCGKQPLGLQIREIAAWLRHEDSNHHRRAVGLPEKKQKRKRTEDNIAEASAVASSTQLLQRGSPVSTVAVAAVATPVNAVAVPAVAVVATPANAVAAFTPTQHQVLALLEQEFAAAPKDLHVAKFGALVSKSPSLTLDTVFRVFAELNQAPAHGLRAFSLLMHKLLVGDVGAVACDVDAVLRALCDHNRFFELHSVGRALGELVHLKQPCAVFAHGLRKLELEFVFGVFEVIFREQRLSLTDRLHGWAALRDHACISTVRKELGRNLDLFERALRVAVCTALPFDLFFAVHGSFAHWYSERHWRLLVAAVELGHVEIGVSNVVCSLEPTIRVTPGAPWLAQTDQDKALSLSAVRARAVANVVGKPKNDMFNKWFDVALAMLDEADARKLEWFSMPLFWLPDVGNSKQLHRIDLNSMPLKLTPLAIRR